MEFDTEIEVHYITQCLRVNEHGNLQVMFDKFTPRMNCSECSFLLQVYYFLCFVCLWSFALSSQYQGVLLHNAVLHAIS